MDLIDLPPPQKKISLKDRAIYLGVVGGLLAVFSLILVSTHACARSSGVIYLGRIATPAQPLSISTKDFLLNWLLFFSGMIVISVIVSALQRLCRKER